MFCDCIAVYSFVRELYKRSLHWPRTRNSLRNMTNTAAISERGACRPSRSTAGPGALSQPHSVCAPEIETPKSSRGRKRGEGCPIIIRLWVWGSVVSSPSGVRNIFYAYFRSERSHLEYPFLVFLSDGAGPPSNVAGSGKTSPSPPSRRSWVHACMLCTKDVYNMLYVMFLWQIWRCCRSSWFSYVLHR